MFSNKYRYQINGDDLNNRHIDLDDASNVRDLGGYKTTDGKHTLEGLLFRAAGLHELSETSVALLLHKGIITDVDLRRTQEIEERIDILGKSANINYVRHNIVGDLPTVIMSILPDEKLEGSLKTNLNTIEERYYKIYTGWLENSKTPIKQALTTLFNPSNLPALYHCEAGKDRTGIISALILSVCGVEDELVAEDYGLSAKYLIDRYFVDQALANRNPNNYTWLDYQNENCSPKVMLKIIDYIKTIYGGTENYIVSLGITKSTLETFKEKFLAS